MRISRIALVTLFLLPACGTRAPGPSEAERGKVAFWKMAEAPQWSFTNCSDDPMLRGLQNQVPFGSNVYFTYRVAADGRSATAVTCSTTDEKTCSDSGSGVELAIADHTLSYAPPAQKSAITGSQCKLQLSQSWVFTDAGETVDGTIELRIALVDSPSDCATVEKSLEARSGNGEGFDGCVMTLKMTGDWATP